MNYDSQIECKVTQFSQTTQTFLHFMSKKSLMEDFVHLLRKFLSDKSNPVRCKKPSSNSPDN